jgi:diaminohydroxyphosphoribosylaminopyrimidine deaminase/5-amino-6-(5-phosphoribosylamino)uracil reductase
VRVLVDRRLRIPPSARLVASARTTPTWILTAGSADPARRRALVASGVEMIEIAAGENGLDLDAALRALGERGIGRLLVEGGARLAAALLEARLVDRLAWFHAPLLIGGDGIPALAGLGIAMLADAPIFERLSTETVGADLLTTFKIWKS